uniref:Reverse transcriptase domain-containing protein n=1 Tax=Haemonchus contortus TaxID=6289 RepID=A0A7I4Z2N0_HAECO
MDDGIDIDTAVKEVPLPRSLKITDASGRVMDFLTAVELDVVNRSDNTKTLVQMLVSQGKEDLAILGTNAIPSMGYQVKKSLRGPREKKTARQREETESNPVAVVKQRVFIAPGQTKYVDLKCEEEWSEAVLNTKDKRIPNGLCKIDLAGVTKVAVVNTSDEPMVMRKGQEVGEWEKAYWDELRFRDTPTDILCSQGKSMSVKKRLDTLFELLNRNRNGRALPPKMQEIVENNNHVFRVVDNELTQTSLVAYDIDTGDTKPIRQKTRPVPIGARDQFKDILSGLLQRRIIEQSTSEWASPVVLGEGR